jgi:hypothetical protein
MFKKKLFSVLFIKEYLNIAIYVNISLLVVGCMQISPYLRTVNIKQEHAKQTEHTARQARAAKG